MSSYKVVSRNALSGLQVKKTVYKSKTDFDKYSPDIIRRWKWYHKVETFVLDENEKWELLDTYPSECGLKCGSCRSFKNDKCYN